MRQKWLMDRVGQPEAHILLIYMKRTSQGCLTEAAWELASGAAVGPFNGIKSKKIRRPAISGIGSSYFCVVL